MPIKDTHFSFLFAADRPFVSRLIVITAGVLTTATFAPLGWYALSPWLMLPLLFVTLTVSPRDAGSHFFWYGLGLFLTGTYWIYISVHVFGNAALWIAVLLMVGLTLIMATYLRLAGWLMARLALGEPWLLCLVAPSTWVLIEWLRGWLFSGFPWLALGYSQTDSWYAGWAPVIGVYGVSYMLMLTACAILVVILVEGRRRWLAIALALLPWLGGGILGQQTWTEPHGEPIRTTIVQAGVSQDRKWLPVQRGQTMEYYRRSTQGVQESDLVVWPEVAVPAVEDQVTGYLDDVAADAVRAGQTVVLGILERGAGDGSIHNSVIVLGAEERHVYRKRHLVPFGEYFPVPQVVRNWMKMQNLPYADLAAGAAVQPLPVTADGTRLAVAICYEDAYAGEQLYAFPDAELIINVSNDGWFGDSIAPHQHLQIARMRAVEFGRYAVRSTNNGISAFIRPDGSLLHAGRQFEPEIATAEVRRHRGATPFARFGNWPVISLSTLILGLFWLRGRAGL